MLGPPQQLEERRLDAGHDRSRLLRLVQAQRPVLLRARADRVRGDVHLDPGVEQVEHRLVDADVGLDPADQRLLAAAEVEALGLRGREADLLHRRHPAGQVVCDLGHGLPQPLRVLLGDVDRHLHRRRAADQRRARIGDRGKVGDGPAKGLLNVDHDQRRPVAVELQAATPIAKLRSL